MSSCGELGIPSPYTLPRPSVSSDLANGPMVRAEVPPPSYGEVERMDRHAEETQRMVATAVASRGQAEVTGNEAIVMAMAEALEDGYEFVLKKKKSGWVFQRRTWSGESFRYCVHLFRGGGYRKEKEERILEFLIERVKEREGRALSENLTDKSLEVAKRFLKKWAFFPDGDLAKELYHRLIAARVGLTKEIMDRNPGFSEFAKRSHLYRYLNFFGHSLKLDIDEQIQLFSKGRYVYWDQLKDEIRWSEHGEWENNYIYDGFHVESRYEWDEWQPYRWRDPNDRPPHLRGEYVFKMCTWTGEELSLTDSPSKVMDSPQIANTHAWFEVWTPEGWEYCVGFTRPLKHELADHFKGPLKRRFGDLMCPDESIVWGGNKWGPPPFVISEAGFYRVKKAVEEDKAKAKRKELIYQLNSENCVVYVTEKARLAGVSISGELPVGELLYPKRVADWSRRLWDSMPAWMRSLAGGSTALVYNTVMLMFGAGKVASNLAITDGKEITPYIRAHFARMGKGSRTWGNWVRNLLYDTRDFFEDLTDVGKLVLFHPQALAWRAYEAFEPFQRLELEHCKDKLAVTRALLEIDSLTAEQRAILVDRARRLELSLFHRVPQQYLLEAPPAMD